MPVTTTSSAEHISSYLSSLLLNEFRYEGAMNVSIPGLEGMPQTKLSGYPVKNITNLFQQDGRKGKTQQIPTVNGLQATPRNINGVDSTYQPITRSYRNITINRPIEVAVKFSHFDKPFWQLPVNEKSDVVKRMARAIHEDVQTQIFALQSSATVLSGIGGSSTTVPTLDIIRQLKSGAEIQQKVSINEMGYLFLNSPQVNYMAAVHGFEASPNVYRSPDQLQARGVEEYTSGYIMKPVLNTQILCSNLVTDGSVSTSTYNLYIRGKDKIGFAFGHVSGFKEWDDNNTSETRMRYELEYSVFLLDPRCVFRVEMIKSPGV